jgi:predicted GNAT family acetyltransferase/N-acetylglutamate synthase-like GNAT family acetyltransferase
MAGPFTIRLATSEDAVLAAGLYANSGMPEAPAAPGEFERMTQTGHAFLIAEDEHGIAGAVRYHDDEGITWFDLLVSEEPGAGRELVLAICRGAQDRGIRLVRAETADRFPLPEYFGRLGFLPVGRGQRDGQPTVTLERRLPLLTVREQRRTDADAIGTLTGEDPWVFEQGARPGWFVAADGDTVVGVISVADAGGGLARISAPTLLESYSGRGLDAWMVERASLYAETNGYHTAELPAEPRTITMRKALEDRFWHFDGDRYLRVYRTPPAPEYE